MGAAVQQNLAHYTLPICAFYKYEVKAGTHLAVRNYLDPFFILFGCFQKRQDVYLCNMGYTVVVPPPSEDCCFICYHRICMEYMLIRLMRWVRIT